MNKTIDDIISFTKHRPWKLPNNKWFWYQEWNDVIFLHYQIEETILRNLVPHYLDLDQINGSYWISIVAFTMNKIHIRNTFQIKYFSNFHEVNLRTYVKNKNKPGVFFLSIEAQKILPTIMANLLSGLPYKYSNIKRSSNSYALLGKRSKIDIEFNIANKIDNPQNIDLWLTERYCLYKNSTVHQNPLEIHHKPWELFHIELKNLNINYKKFSGYVNFNSPSLSHYSPGVKVIAWNQ